MGSNSANLEAALGYAARGWRVHPLIPGQKEPLLTGWQNLASDDPQIIACWWERWPDANIGIATGHGSGLVVLDVDVKDGRGGAESFDALQKQYGGPFQTTISRTPSGGWHVYFAPPPDDDIGNRADVMPGIDVRGEGGYVVAPPSVFEDVAYEWALVEAACRLPDGLTAVLKRRNAQRKDNGADGSGQAIRTGQRNTHLASLAGSMRRRGMSAGAIEAGLQRTNRECCEPPLDDVEVQQIAASVARYEPDEDAAALPIVDLDIPDTDMANAQRLVQRHGLDLHWTPERGWLVWDGRRWQPDDTGMVMAKAKAAAASVFDEIRHAPSETVEKLLFNWARKSRAAKQLKDMVFLTQSEPEIPLRYTEFDTDAWAFNVANGTINLHTGKLRPHHREDKHSKLSPIAFDPDASCERWCSFLDEILPKAVVAYLQRLIGYRLTGLNREQIIVILYGVGSNGKSVFLESVRRLFGEYGRSTRMETFALKGPNAIPNDVAALAGSRLVCVSETAQNQKLNEPLIKDVTGGDAISARFMRREWFEFVPHFTPLIRANHRPQIQGTDEGIWRRIHLVPFNVHIEPQEQDKQLQAKLLEELPGILNWAVEGCAQWRGNGLAPPAIVNEATQAYRRDMDLLGDFLSECMAINEEAKIKASALQKVYREWCESAGEKPITTRQLSGAMQERGFTKRRLTNGWHYVGLSKS